MFIWEGFYLKKTKKYTHNKHKQGAKGRQDGKWKMISGEGYHHQSKRKKVCGGSCKIISVSWTEDPVDGGCKYMSKNTHTALVECS